MAYHKISCALEGKTVAFSNNLKTLSSTELPIVAKEIVSLLYQNTEFNKLTSENKSFLFIEITFDVSLNEQLNEQINLILIEQFQHIIFHFPQYLDELSHSKLRNFAGSYLRQKSNFLAGGNPKASELVDFIKKNRVAILEEGDGRDLSAYITTAIGSWQKNHKQLLPIFLNETLVSYHEVFTAMYSFLMEIYKTDGLEQQIKLLKTTQEKLELLVSLLHEYGTPVFIFENISSWFDATGKPIYPRRDVTDWLYKLVSNEGEYVIITTGNIAGELSKLPFFKKDVNSWSNYKYKMAALLQKYESIKVEAIEPCDEETLKEFFTKTFGNEVVLELALWLQLRGLVSLKILTKDLPELKKGLVKTKFLKLIIQYLPEQVLVILSELAHFTMPVRHNAFTENLKDIDISNWLPLLPLISKYQNQDDEILYYLHPSCRPFFSRLNRETFNYNFAADWHKSKLQVPQFGLAHLKEAFRHYKLAQNDEGFKQTATSLCIHFYKAGNYPVAHYYGLACYQKFEKKVPQSLLHCMAKIFKKYKKPEESLFFFKILHEKLVDEPLHKKLIQILNYMSMLSFELKQQQDYVNYGLQAYKLALQLKETKDIYLLGISLGRYLYIGGKKEGGLKMMQQSYQIGMKKGYADVGVLELFLREIGEL